ncbi:Hypothetical protein FKW44_003171 [Caligus rogercresseyi]|uniref:Uncharacterized protein n=1 Tax=Caligus rogercresseyi TaxID=217165 RepID=A0A7T8QWV1_CALRO|nr:Hypothetical protein FKW44_003171 [Caligus rogercresseyi]
MLKEPSPPDALRNVNTYRENYQNESFPASGTVEQQHLWSLASSFFHKLFW